MGPYDPQEVELFEALAWCDEQEQEHGAGGLERLRHETMLAAW